MLGGLRLLTEEEIEQVAGVYDGCGGMWPPEYYTTTIYVTYTPPTNPWVQSMSLAYYMDHYYQDPYAQMSYTPPTGGGGSGGSSPNYPTTFNHQLDNSVDSTAASIAAEIAAKSDDGQREYGAVIWKDANGNVHRTTVTPGTDGPAANWDPASVWNQIDFANGGEVVGIIHSHPHQNTGLNGDTISSADFDRLMAVAQNTAGYQSGYDNVNFRDYLVYNGVVSEYYGFDQNAAYVGAGGQATWAVASTDYGN